MEPRPERRPRRSSPPPPSQPPPAGTRSHGMDRLSALSDDMLRLVLAHLGCARAAVQTSLLSRRWRRTWNGLSDLTFRGLAPATMEAAFRSFAGASPPVVSTLDISLSSRHTQTSANSVLRAAMWLSPGHLLITLQDPSLMGYIELPCFQSTTSIEINTGHSGIVKPLPAGGEFTVLDTLSITGPVMDLRSLLGRCPRLRVLSISHPDMHLSPTTLPPASEFPALEKLSLSGKIVDLGPLLDSCKCLRELSVTQTKRVALDLLHVSGEFPVLEKLSLSGNIADFATVLSCCPRLCVLGVTFRGMALGSIEAGLTTLQEYMALHGGIMSLSLLGVEYPWRDDVDAARFNSLLRVVARLSPLQVIFTDNYEGCITNNKVNADLPCFPHATSIVMGLRYVCFTTLPAGEFLALRRLSVSGQYGILDIATLVTRCPCLQVLNVTVPMFKITVHSLSLQKVYLSYNMDENTECHHVDIVTPMLKQLQLDVHAARNMGVSISAPAVDKVSWRSTYTTSSALLFGSWRLQIMSVETMDNRDGTCWQQLPRFHVLCLHLNAGNHLDEELNFAQEIEKVPVTNFSVVELYFKYQRHVYGPFVLQLLRLCQIRAATKKLRVILPWWHEEKQACLRNCPCDKPKNWRRQNILYTSLEEVEIIGFNGEDHENDFLTLVFTCSPMLKRLTMMLAENFGGCTKKLTSICMAYPSVNCSYRHFNSSELVVLHAASG